MINYILIGTVNNGLITSLVALAGLIAVRLNFLRNVH